MTSYIDLANKRVLVTGASSGIGRKTAQELAGRGVHVILTGRDSERLGATLTSLAPGDHLAVAGDLTTADGVNALVDACGVLDGVVHSAGRIGASPLKLLSEKFLDDVMNVNFRAPVLLTQRLLAKSRIKNGASLVFLSSISAHTGTKGMTPYSASKAAILGLVRPAAIELAPKKIRVNALSPALVRTEMFKPDEQEWLNEQEKRYVLGLGRAEDVANAVIFLLSDASRYITGAAIIMDGGCDWV